MNKLLLKKYLKTPLFKYAMLTISLLLLVWGLGPYLAIANKMPFRSLSSRLTTSTILIAIWVIYFLWQLIQKMGSRPPKSVPDSYHQAQELLSTLRENFKTLWRFLKKHPMGSFFQRHKRPWILLLGTSGSGKTTLLNCCGIKLASPTELSSKSIKPTRLIDWWISNSAVFIDPAGKYALPKASDTIGNTLWRSFLKLSKRYRDKHPIDHLVLVIDFPSLCASSNEEIEQLAERFTRQMHSIKEFNKTLSTSIIISQCDRIAGFNEYFADLGEEERAQNLGFKIPQNVKDPALMEIFEEQFHKLIKRLSEQLIWRLHHEQSITRRKHIKDFPLQLEKFSTVLEQIISQLPWNTTTRLEGVYLTSSVQKGDSIDLIGQPIKEIFKLSTQSQPVNSMRQKDFFLKQLMQRINTTTDFSITQKRQNIWKLLLAYTTAAGLIFGFTYLWHYGYRQNIDTLRIIETNISQGSFSAATSNLPWLTRLNTLHKTLQDLNRHDAIHYQWAGLSQAAKLKTTTLHTYQRLLRSMFQPYLIHLLTEQMHMGIQGNKIILYSALKTTLMLINPARYNPKAIEHWLNITWSKQYPHNRKLREQLSQHLHNLLKMKQLLWPFNRILLEQAQASLKQLPLADLAFLELRGEYPLDNVPLLPDLNKIKGINLAKATIPVFYSAKSFKRVYDIEIPNLAQQLAWGDWVVGVDKAQPLNRKQKHELITEIRNLYLNFYAQQWQSVITKIRLTPPNNLVQAYTAIRLLTDPHSQLHQLLHIIVKNATVNQGLDSKALNSNIDLTAIKDFLNQTGSYKNIQTKLINLANYLDKIAASPSANKTSYDIAINRFEHKGANDPITNLLSIAKKAPTPIQSWFNTLAHASWKIILKDTKEYLNSIWETTVLPEYNTNIKQRYPIFKKAKSEISIQNFTQFFGPDGSIGNFFVYYLKPFVNTKKKYWGWKTLDDMTLDIPQATLDMFIRASMIQQMFYTDNATIPTFHFKLIPINLSSQVSAFSLNIGGQMIDLSQGSNTISHAVWPGPDPSFVTLRFTTYDGQTPTISNTNVWALFKLFNQFELQSTSNPKEYLITFKMGDLTASYELVTDHKVNPFLPGILQAFRCPQRL